MWTVHQGQDSHAVDRQIDGSECRANIASTSKGIGARNNLNRPVSDAMNSSQVLTRTDRLLHNWLQQSDAVLHELEDAPKSSRTLDDHTPERPQSANHSTEEAIKALMRAGITVDSCLVEKSFSSGGEIAEPSVADEELVMHTLQLIEGLYKSLLCSAPEGPYTERKLDALTGTRLWFPTALAASKHGIAVTSRPEDDPNQRQAWLGPGSGPRFKSPADRERAAKLREATLATGRVPNPAALEKAIGRSTIEELDERLSGTFSSSSASTDLPPMNSEMQADAGRIAAMLGGESYPNSSLGGGVSNASDVPFVLDTSPMNSTLPSLEGGYDYRISDAHTDISDGPPDPPSMSGGIFELLHASLPTVKEEEFTGSIGAPDSSMRTSNSQLHLRAASPTHDAIVPEAMHRDVQAVADSHEGDGNQLQPQAPVESKLSVSGFGGSYMTMSPAHSVLSAPTPSMAVSGVATSGAAGSNSAGHSAAGLMPSMTGPPSGIVLTGMSSMGPVSSMLSGPTSPSGGAMSTYNAAGRISGLNSLIADPDMPSIDLAPAAQAAPAPAAESEFNKPSESPTGNIGIPAAAPPQPAGPDSIGTYPERQPSSSVAPSVSVPLDAGPSSTGASPTPVIHYIDRVPSAVADIDFERQPASQSSMSRAATVARDVGYAGASPPTSSNAGGPNLQGTGLIQAQRGPLGPTSFVGVIHDTMSSLNESIFGTVLNTIRTQDSANLADIDADDTAALNEPTAAFGDASMIACDIPDTSELPGADDDAFVDASASAQNSLSFVQGTDIDDVTAAFPTPRAIGRAHSQQKLAAEALRHAEGHASDVSGPLVGHSEREQFTSVHAGQEPSAMMSVDSGHLDGDSLLVAPNTGLPHGRSVSAIHTASSIGGSQQDSRSVSFISHAAPRASMLQYATDYTASLPQTDPSMQNIPAESQAESSLHMGLSQYASDVDIKGHSSNAGGGSSMHLQGGLSQYASEMGAESSMVGHSRHRLGGLSAYASEIGGWASSMGGAASSMVPMMAGHQSRLQNVSARDLQPVSQDGSPAGMNYCAEPEASMLSSVDGGSRMEGGESSLHNDHSFLADAHAPQSSPSSLRQRMSPGGNRMASAYPLAGPASQLSSIMEGSQGDVTMSVSAWARNNAALPEGSTLDSELGHADGASACSSERMAAGESLLSDSAVIVPSRTAVRSRTRGSLRSRETSASASEPIKKSRGRTADAILGSSASRVTSPPRRTTVDLGMGDNSSLLEAPATGDGGPRRGNSRHASTPASQRSSSLKKSPHGSRSSRIPRPNSLSSAASGEGGTPRAASAADTPPQAPTTNSRRLTDLFLPTSPSFANDGSPGSSALGSATSGVDADISAALDEESRMDYPGPGSRLSPASQKARITAQQTRKPRPSTKDTSKSTPRESITSVSAMVSTPGRNEDGSEGKTKPSRAPTPTRASGSHVLQPSSSGTSSSFCEPEGLEDDTSPAAHALVKPAQNGLRTGSMSSVTRAHVTHAGGSSGSGSGSHSRRLTNGSAATTDPALHDSLQPPQTPDESPVPGACTRQITKTASAGALIGKAAYAQTAALVSAGLRSIRKSNTITYVGDSHRTSGSEDVKGNHKFRTLSANDISSMGADLNKRDAAQASGGLRTKDAASNMERSHPTKGQFDGMPGDRSNLQSEMSQVLQQQQDFFATAESLGQAAGARSKHISTQNGTMHADSVSKAPTVHHSKKNSSQELLAGSLHARKESVENDKELRQDVTNELSAASAASLALDRQLSKQPSNGHQSATMPMLHRSPSATTSITQGPPDLAAIAAAAAAADSRSLVSRMASASNMDAVPRPLVSKHASPTGGVLELSASNFSKSAAIVKPSDIHVQADDPPPPGGCCLFPFCFKN